MDPEGTTTAPNGMRFYSRTDKVELKHALLFGFLTFVLGYLLRPFHLVDALLHLFNVR